VNRTEDRAIVPLRQRGQMGVATGVSTPGTARGLPEARVTRVLRSPALWLTGLVGLSALVRAAISLRVPAPWILPDEIVYSELAKSIAAGDRPSIRGVPVFGWGEVYPTLIAPAWVLIEDPFWAYHGALAINAVVMSLAALPAYLLARMFVSEKASLIVAAATVFVPSMSYTGVVMTENAFYPVFLLSLWLIVRAVRSPTLVNQALVLLGLGLVAFTRIQGIALVGAYVVAVGLYSLALTAEARGAYLRRFAPSAALAMAVSLAPTVGSLVVGDGPFGWLGARSGTFDTFVPLEVPQWFAYLLGDLALYVAVAPAAATALILARGLSPRRTQEVRLFTAVALPTMLAMLASVALVSASLDVDGTENLNERYVFYVVPLTFVGLAIWIREGLPRPRRLEWALVAALCMLAVVVPIERLEHNANFQSLALMPWLGLPVSGVVLHALVAGFVAASVFVWVRAQPRTIGRVWLLVAVTMGLAFGAAYASASFSATSSASPFQGQSRNWVDKAVPARTEVPVVWIEPQTGSARRLDPLYPWIMVTEFFNDSVAEVYRVGPATYYEDFLPTVPVHAQAGGTLVDERGRRLRSRYVLVSCRAAVEGQVVGTAPGRALLLIQIDGRLRLTDTDRCGSAFGE
jgi:hypothetical protein